MSWGSGSWGSTAWGGGMSASLLAPTPSEFDVYCFDDASAGMFNILTDLNVSTAGPGAHFVPNGGTGDLDIFSGGAFPTSDARLYISSVVAATWSLEFNILCADLPQDFNDLPTEHIFLGVTDAAGACAGLFFSKQGLAYAGAIHHTGGGDLVLDSTLYPIPGSEDYIDEDVFITVRIVADNATSTVYLFATLTSELGLTGHVLRAILPAIPAGSLAFPPTDRTTVSVRGTITDPSSVSLDRLCLANAIVMPNLAPVADAGQDQAAHLCSIIRLDGSSSFDPEGAPLTYEWRLIDAPSTSFHTFQGKDGETTAGPGFTDKFYSATELAAEDALVPVVPGDVLNVGGVPYEIIAKGSDGGGFFVQIFASALPEGLSEAGFKLLRQNGISGATTATPTFFPDVPGFYKFDLLVTDGVLPSDPSGIDREPVVINVLESILPRGCTPDLKFIFNYLSDFWRLVEDRDVIAVFWSALAQAAATELYTLWQHEYGKSLRDIQRTFVRRWLHYDLLLPEPLPELTTIRVTWAGVTSVAIPDAGAAGVSGTLISLESELFEEAETFQFYSPDPVTPELVLMELNNRLAEIDSRFAAFLIDDRSTTNKYIRIRAPFPFSIGSATTCPLFTVGDKNQLASGSSGAAVGLHTYKVERSLLRLDIRENDLLLIDGEGYRIFQVIDDASDALPFQRIVVKEDLPVVPSSDWVISGYVTSELLNFYNGMVSSGDAVYFEVTDPRPEFASTAANHAIVQTVALGTNETASSTLAFDPEPIGAYLAQSEEATVRLAKVVRRSNVPISELVVDIPTLQDVIVVEDEQAVLRRNLDYLVQEYRGRLSIQFESGRSGGPDVWEGEVPPDRLWAEYTYIDNSPTIEANFGIPAEFTLDHLSQLSTDLDYLSAVRGLWYAYYHGPTVHNIRIGTQILLGLPFAEEPGTIEEIRTDFSASTGRILIRDLNNEEIVRSYSYPRVLDLETNPTTGAAYKVGDKVTQFAPLVAGAEVIDYLKEPTWYQGLLHQGIFYEPEKFFKFLVRVDSAAFSLSTLSFVRNFVLKIKPTYTLPLFVVRYDVNETGTEVNVTDQVLFTGVLTLAETPCAGFLGATTKYDDPRAAGGGWRNQFDEDADPATADPAYATPDANIVWAWDKQFLCPEDGVSGDPYVMFDGVAAISSDDVFPFGVTVDHYIFYADSPLTTVPLAGHTMSLDSSRCSLNDAIDTSTLDELRLTIWGNPGADPTDYELVVVVNGSPQTPIPFTAGPFGFEGVFSLSSISVTAGDPIDVVIQPASGVGARNPNWNLVEIRVAHFDVLTWNNAAVPPEGTYGDERILL